MHNCSCNLELGHEKTWKSTSDYLLKLLKNSTTRRLGHLIWFAAPFPAAHPKLDVGLMCTGCAQNWQLRKWKQSQQTTTKNQRTGGDSVEIYELPVRRYHSPRLMTNWTTAGTTPGSSRNLLKQRCLFNGKKWTAHRRLRASICVRRAQEHKKYLSRISLIKLAITTMMANSCWVVQWGVQRSVQRIEKQTCCNLKPLCLYRELYIDYWFKFC